MVAPDPGHPEGPQRRVRITRAILLQETEVTRSAWRALTEGDSFAADCRFDDDACPADNLNFYDAAYYANVLSDAHALERCYDLQGCSGAVGVDLECGAVGFGGLDCEGYRLPTEAEWEYAARAGSRARFAHGDDVCRLIEYACYRDELDDLEADCERADPPRDGATVCAVGLRRANGWGAYDMHGSLWEWTNDAYAPYAAAQAEDPVVPPGAENVHRGGSFSSPSARSTVYARGANGSSGRRTDNLGFRLVRTVPTAGE